MKKAILFSLLFVLVSAVFVSAQQSEDEKIFAKTVLIDKIYIHADGYKILYMKADGHFASFYIPMSWFTSASSKAELVLANDPSYPYFSIFWVNGEFDHIRIYAYNNYSHSSWGELDKRYDFSEQFNIDTLEPEF